MSDEKRSERGFEKAADLSYGSYLKIPELLGLQRCQSDPAHHDELQFIVVHQVFELWFKLLLHELEGVRAALLGADVDRADHLLLRVNAIESQFAPTLRVLETMTPADFLGFRDLLRPASGFQSVQFREVEVLSGLREQAYLEFLRKENVPEVAAAVDRRLEELSLREAMHAMLEISGHPVGWSMTERRHDEKMLREVLREIYRTQKPRSLYRVLEGLVQHDENLALWRQHHVALVERQIGTRMGTGGSSGAAYLRSTSRYRFFPELWQARADLSPEGY